MNYIHIYLAYINLSLFYHYTNYMHIYLAYINLPLLYHYTNSLSSSCSIAMAAIWRIT